MSEGNFVIRLKFLINQLGISDSKFADTCGITRSTLSLMLSGKNKKISDVIIGQIHKSYPDLSINWLLFNEGEMWNSNNTKLSANTTAHDESEASEKSTGVNDRAADSLLSSNDFNFSDEVDEFIEDASSIATQDPQNSSQNPKIRMDGQRMSPQGKENGLNHPINSTEQSLAKDINYNLKNQTFLDEIAKIKAKPRNVVQITIYYDDSTFETFYPGK